MYRSMNSSNPHTQCTYICTRVSTNNNMGINRLLTFKGRRSALPIAPQQHRHNSVTKECNFNVLDLQYTIIFSVMVKLQRLNFLVASQFWKNMANDFDWINSSQMIRNKLSIHKWQHCLDLCGKFSVYFCFNISLQVELHV